MKRFLCAAGAALAIAVAVPSVAGAAPHGHWHGGHGWHGGHFGGPGVVLRFGAPYRAYNSCYQLRPVWRHHHRVWRRVFVC